MHAYLCSSVWDCVCIILLHVHPISNFYLDKYTVSQNKSGLLPQAVACNFSHTGKIFLILIISLTTWGDLWGLFNWWIDDFFDRKICHSMICIISNNARLSYWEKLHCIYILSFGIKYMDKKLHINSSCDESFENIRMNK